MHKVALLKGKLVDVDSAKIPAVSAAAMYGHGVFTTIAVYNGEPFVFEKHWRRLSDNAAKLGIGIQFSSDEIESLLRDLIAANNLVDGRARITLFDSGGAGLWNGRAEKRTDVLITTAEPRQTRSDLRLDVSRFRINSRSPLAAVKSCNYLEHLIAYEDARRCGLDEVIRLNERDEVASAAMANIFWLKGGRLYTPALSTGCLAGTTREFIMENLECSEAIARLEELLGADSIFLSSAGIGIGIVTSVGEATFKLAAHPILDLLPPKTKTRMSAK